MKRQIKSTLLVAAALASVFGSTLPASACGGRGGGVSRGFSRPAFSRPVFSSQTANYSRPVVQYQPAYSQPVYASSVQNQQIHPQPIQVQPVQNQVVYNQPTYVQPAKPIAPTTITSKPAASRRITQTIPTVKQAVVKQSVAKPEPSNQSAERSALQALVSISTNTASTTSEPQSSEATDAVIPEFTTASSTTIANHVGTWLVSLPGNQSVRLTLAADGKFSWKATKSGKTSQFGGQYRLADGKLTLVRSNDLQQMTGSWTVQNAGFTFKLDGAKTGGLNFKRS